MCLQKGNLNNKIITKNHSQYSLLGMVNPTFQNQGTANVYIDGRLIQPNESFAINCPNIILQNAIPITFENDPAKTKILYVGFVNSEQ